MVESEQNFWDINVYVEYLKQQPSDRISAIVAHDIGNRVGGVVGYAEMLKKYFSGEIDFELDQNEILDMFNIISTNGRQIMNVLQALNRFEHQKLPEEDRQHEPIEPLIPQDDITHAPITSAKNLPE